MAGAGQRECGSVPHGGCSVLTTVMIFFAWILSIGAAFNCAFMETDNANGTTLGFGWIGYGDRNRYYSCFGNTCIYEDSWCNSWTNSSKYFDSYWTAGFAMAVVAFCLGFFAMIFGFMLMCRAFEPATFNIAACCFFIICICEGLSLLMLNSDLCKNLEANTEYTNLDCRMGWGASIASAATALWFLSAVLIKCTPAYSEDDEPELQEQEYETTVTEEVTKNEDGTEEVVQTKVTKFPDGTEKVETKTTTR